MEALWHADITNNPDRDFELWIDLYEGPSHRGTILRDPAGSLVLRWFTEPDKPAVDVPAAWLCSILASAEVDLPKSGPVENE